MKSFADFLAESDSEDGKEKGGGILQEVKRPTRPVSASTAASDEAGMMIGGVKVRMPGQSRPASASSSSTLSRPTSAASFGGRWQPSGALGSQEKEERSKSPAPVEKSTKGTLGPVDSLRGRSKSPAPDESSKKGMLGLGPVDSLQGRSKSPAPDESSKKGMLGLGPVDSLRGRSKSPAPDESPKKGMLGLGPVDSLKGRSKSPAPDESPKKGMLGLGPVDSLRGRSKSPAPDESSNRPLAPWEQPSFGSRDAPFPPGPGSSFSAASTPSAPSAPSAPRPARPGSAARSREAPPSQGFSFSSFSPPPPSMMDLTEMGAEDSEDSQDESFEKKKKKDKKEKKEKKSKKEKKEKKAKKEQKEREEREAEERRQREKEEEKRAQKERKKEEKRLQKQREKEEEPRAASAKKEQVRFDVHQVDDPVAVAKAPAPDHISAPSSSRPKQSHLKTGRPRIRRFLLNFDPLGFTVVWEKNGQRKATALRVDPEELVDHSSQRSFAKRLVKKWSQFLQEHHTSQVEALLQRLALRVLPIYRVESPQALGTWESPGRPSKEPLFLPPGVMFLVVERTRCADGWWLRLASGKKWVPEKLMNEVVCISCNPSLSQATESLRSLRFDKKPSSVLERNARLVCSQLSKSAALS